MTGVTQERALIDRAQRGDLDAFGELLRVHQADANRLTYVITGQRGDAEDAVQEGFVNAWRALARFDSKRPFRPWLLKIVANAARMRRRAAGNRERLHLRAAKAASVEGGEPSLEAQVVDRLDLRRVLDEIERLPEADAITLKLRYFADLTTPEIAELLDEPAGTIRSRLSRATRKLRDRLADENAPAPSAHPTWKRPDNDRGST